MNDYVNKLFSLACEYDEGVSIEALKRINKRVGGYLDAKLSTVSVKLTQDFAKAFRYYHMVLFHEPTHQASNRRLGEIYYEGLGTPRSLLAARYFFQQGGITLEDGTKMSDGRTRGDVARGTASFWQVFGDGFYNKVHECSGLEKEINLILATEAYLLSIQVSEEQSGEPQRHSAFRLASIAKQKNQRLLAIKYLKMGRVEHSKQHIKNLNAWLKKADLCERKRDVAGEVLYLQCALEVATEDEKDVAAQIASRLGWIYFDGKSTNIFSRAFFHLFAKGKSSWETVWSENQTVDVPAAIYYYGKALEGNDEEAHTRFKRIGARGHYYLGLDAFEKGYKENGINSVSSEILRRAALQEGIKFLQWAAFDADPLAMFCLGVFYKYGAHGFHRSALIASHWFFQAMQRGVEKAREEIGDFISWEKQFNHLVTKKGSETKAFYCTQWMLLHTDNRHMVLMQIGKLYKQSYANMPEGERSPQNLGKALIYYTAAEIVAKNETEWSAARVEVQSLERKQWILSYLVEHGAELALMSYQLAYYGMSPHIKLFLLFRACSIASSYCLSEDKSWYVESMLGVVECAFGVGSMMYKEKPSLLQSIAVNIGGRFLLTSIVDSAYPGILPDAVEASQKAIFTEQREAMKVRTHFIGQDTSVLSSDASPSNRSAASLLAERWSGGINMVEGPPNAPLNVLPPSVDNLLHLWPDRLSEEMPSQSNGRTPSSP